MSLYYSVSGYFILRKVLGHHLRCMHNIRVRPPQLYQSKLSTIQLNYCINTYCNVPATVLQYSITFSHGHHLLDIILVVQTPRVIIIQCGMIRIQGNTLKLHAIHPEEAAVRRPSVSRQPAIPRPRQPQSKYERIPPDRRSSPFQA